MELGWCQHLPYLSTDFCENFIYIYVTIVRSNVPLPILIMSLKNTLSKTEKILLAYHEKHLINASVAPVSK